MNRYLVLHKIVELGSFTKAAEFLGYTQSAVSQMIASLEEELSIKLLIRSRAGVRLTLEGVELYPHIERLLLQYRAVKEKACEITGLSSGTIRIGTGSSISAHWLPSLLKGFRERYPGVEFILHQGDYSLFQEWIKTGAVDFAFVNPAAVNGIETIPLKAGAMLAVLPEEHPLASLEAVPLEALAEESFILLEEGHYSEPLEAFRKLNLRPNISYTIHDDHSIMSMVEAGLGVSILAELVLHRTDYHIVRRPTIPPVSRTLAIGYQCRDSLPIASKYFIDYIIEHIDQLS